MSDQSDTLTRTSITLPEDLKRKARTIAILRDTNLSAVIRDLLTQWIEENGDLVRLIEEAQAR